MPNICYCDNGSGAVNTECPDHGGHFCVTCNIGYHFEDIQIPEFVYKPKLQSTHKRCFQNECTCRHGTGTIKEDCLIHDDEVYANCDHLFILNSESKSCFYCPSNRFEGSRSLDVEVVCISGW